LLIFRRRCTSKKWYIACMLCLWLLPGLEWSASCWFYYIDKLRCTFNITNAINMYGNEKMEGKFCLNEKLMLLIRGCIDIHILKKLTFFLFCTITNKCTIISQNITLLHVSTLSCRLQGVCNQCLAKLHRYFTYSCS
jgi:hypothetical protein